MNPQIDTLKKIRAFLLEGIKDLTTEQLNKIPEGFNNNIIWNLGHLVAAQQGMCYKRANLAPHISDEFWEKFRTGSKPNSYIGAEEIAKIKNLFLHTMDELDGDYNKGIFGNYTAWSTRYGVEIASIEDALKFLPFHEGLHTGVISTMRKLL
ncbi:MAG: DinB family protein [Bacteroidetes bacterium]|nr:DinB family protein [Bacteroidota bacterium]